VGHLAEKIGTSPRTIKHWEEKGIIEPDMRSQGGFRLYGEHYVYLCQLIKDLQLFGYSLEEIKTISDYFRLFIDLKENPDQGDAEENERNFARMMEEIEALFEKIRLLREGMARWEDLARKKKKEITVLRTRNQKRIDKGEEK
jgi:DNA-binding transcriptional MerR regulator